MKLHGSRALSQKLALYGLGIGAASLASSAEADIVYSGPVELSGNTIYFDLQNTAVPSASTTSVTGDDFEMKGNTSKSKAKIYNAGTYNSSIAYSQRGPANRDYALRLSMGDTIGSQSFSLNAYFQDNYAGGTEPKGYGLGDWNAGDRGFVGLRLTINGNSYFGWADVTLNNLDGSGPGVFTLHDFAFDNVAGDMIQAGQIPEPSTVALLIAGAAGVLALKKRKQK